MHRTLTLYVRSKIGGPNCPRTPFSLSLTAEEIRRIFDDI